MQKELVLVRTFGTNSLKELSHYASLATAPTGDWYWQAAQLIGSRTPSGKAFLTVPYDYRTGFGYSLWHHGTDTIASFYGQADSLTQYIRLTENEKESIYLETRKHTRRSQVLAIAHNHIRDDTFDLQAIMKEKNLELDGCIVVQFA